MMRLNMRCSKTITIGLVLDFFNPRVLEGAHAYLEQHNIKLDARWSVRGDWAPEKPEWDGLIYGIFDNLELLNRVQRWKMPKVSLSPDIKELWAVQPDYMECGVSAARELVDTGVTKLLLADSSYRLIDEEFSKGAIKFAEINGVDFEKITLAAKDLSPLVEQIKNDPQKLGFCHPHAGTAYGLQDLLINNGIDIPEKVSMVVIEKDIQLTPLLSRVPLTTIELNEWHRGFVAAEMLHRIIIDDPLPQRRLQIPVKGITKRASTGHEVVKDRVASKAFNYVRKNYLKPIGVVDVVAAVGVSRRVVEMRFRETLNRGIHEELTRLRIEEAKRLISKKSSTVTQIAETCGFSSVHYFSTAFKRETGVSPKQYQKQHY